MRLRIKNKSHRYDINRLRPKHGHKSAKYKMCLIIMMVRGIKQHLSKIWSSNQKKWSNTEAELEKAVAYKKSVYFFLDFREGQSDENDGCDFEILLYFEAATAAELLNKQNKIFKFRIFSHSLSFCHEFFTRLISSTNLMLKELFLPHPSLPNN